MLIMDNRESHITIDSLTFCKNNGIILLTIPPHTSHKLQPLDRTVYGSLKKFFNSACNTWMISNPGKMISIYNVAALLGQAYPQAFTPLNIMRGFEKTGIWPYNRDIFTDDEFLTSYMSLTGTRVFYQIHQMHLPHHRIQLHLPNHRTQLRLSKPTYRLQLMFCLTVTYQPILMYHPTFRLILTSPLI